MYILKSKIVYIRPRPGVITDLHGTERLSRLAAYDDDDAAMITVCRVMFSCILYICAVFLEAGFETSTMEGRNPSRASKSKLESLCSHINSFSCVCVVVPFILDVRLVDVPAGVTQAKGHTGFLHFPSAVLALIFIARRIQPSLSLVDREVEFLCTHELLVLHLLGIFFFLFL